MSKRLEYLTLLNNIKIAEGAMEDFKSQYIDPLWSYYRNNCGGHLESIEIDDISDTHISYTIQTSFRNEYDDPVQHTIPIEACKSFDTIKQYYDLKTMEEERKRVEQEQQEKERMTALIAEAEIREYQRLKEKFEGAKNAI